LNWFQFGVLRAKEIFDLKKSLAVIKINDLNCVFL